MRPVPRHNSRRRRKVRAGSYTVAQYGGHLLRRSPLKSLPCLSEISRTVLSLR